MDTHILLISQCILHVGYIGPGAGFAFLGSFLIMLLAVLLALLSILSFPFRLISRAVFRAGRHVKPKAEKIIVIGFDGLDPALTEKLMARGELPHLARIKEEGSFSKLNTTCPPISPVAWSSFATGVNPGKHNIFDFLNRDLSTYMPELSSCRITSSGKKAETIALRKSKPFWHLLGEHGIFSTILRVPITFPPEKFKGLLLSGMCVPDIMGTQGTFTFYESESSSRPTTGGQRILVSVDKNTVKAKLPGPSLNGKTINSPFSVRLRDDYAVISISGRKITLVPGKYTDWTCVKFRNGLRGINGICRFLLLSMRPFRLYVTPVNIDPEHPAMPISNPAYYSAYLAKLNGPYSTLGLAEDTWALNENIISETEFIQQVYDIHEEREKMFLNALKRVRKGVCCCVFDATDRIQHMFHNDQNDAGKSGESQAVNDIYRRMDNLVGEVIRTIDEHTVLFVISDHGFTEFRRGVNFNVWLKNEGFLTLKDNSEGNEYLRDVDWTKTRAYSFGLSGIYLNMAHREAKGIISTRNEKNRIKKEIINKLQGLQDPQTNEVAVKTVADSDTVFSGPYKNNGPDLIVGCCKGYRASWENAVGRVTGDVFSDNTKHWDGDHCVDSSLVPGVLFCSRKVENIDKTPSLMDMAPTILDLCGIAKPDYMDGTVLRIVL